MKTLEENIRLYEQAQEIRRARNAELHQQAKGTSTHADSGFFERSIRRLGGRSDCGKKTRSPKT